MKTLPLLACLMTLGAAGPQAPEPPAFGASVNAVAIDVVALDADGQPATDLRPDEFVVKLDGKPRRVVSARYRSYESHAPLESQVPTDTDPPFSSNHSFTPGRVLAIVVDQGRLGPGRSRVLAALAEHFVPRLGPRDVAMLATLPGPITRVPFTSDRAKLRGALAAISGASRFAFPRLQLGEAMAFAQRDLSWREVTERECPEGRASDSAALSRNCVSMLESEARAVLETFQAENTALVNGLRGLIGALGQVPGPKQVVLLTAGFGDQGGSELPTLMQEADTARVSFHVMLLEEGAEVAQAVARRRSEERYARTAGAARLSGLSGGSLLRIVGSGESAALRLAGELSGDYTLGFEAAAAEMDGASHELSVEVTRHGVSARTWERIRLQGAAPSKPEEVLASALRGRDLQVDLPVKVATYALREPPSENTKVVVVADVGDRTAPPAAVAVAFLLSDEAGRVVASGFQPASDAPPDRQALFIGSAHLPPGRYRLRLAALDANGRIGSVEHPVNASVTAAGGLEIGDLILAASSGSAGPPRPSVDLDLRGSDLVTYLEVYGGDANVLNASSVTFQVLGLGEDEALLSAPADIRSEGGNRRLVQRTVAAGLLPPGEYVAQAVVAVGGGTVRRLSRPFHVAGTAAGATPGRVAFDDVATALPPFDITSVLDPEVVVRALEQLQRRTSGPAARSALQRAREGHIRDLAELADGDPLSSPFLRGLAHYAGGDSRAAAEQFRIALRAASDFFPAAFYLGACYAAQGKDLEAAGAWRTSLIGGAGPGVVHRLIGEALLRGRDAEQAVEALLEPGPPDGASLRALGLAYSLTGRRAEAVAALGGYVDGHPEDLSTTFLTLRLLFADQAAQGAEFKERQRLQRFAQAYVAAGGPQRALVTRWLSYLAQD